ncbi:hypothetical protein DYQ38_00175 [Dichelobacter nodosus]|nr:hypothetical protein DYQ38_00175 [Dichelobacter nodosus]
MHHHETSLRTGFLLPHAKRLKFILLILCEKLPDNFIVKTAHFVILQTYFSREHLMMNSLLTMHSILLGVFSFLLGAGFGYFLRRPPKHYKTPVFEQKIQDWMLPPEKDDLSQKFDVNVSSRTEKILQENTQLFAMFERQYHDFCQQLQNNTAQLFQTDNAAAKPENPANAVAVTTNSLPDPTIDRTVEPKAEIPAVNPVIEPADSPVDPTIDRTVEPKAEIPAVNPVIESADSPVDPTIDRTAEPKAEIPAVNPVIEPTDSPIDPAIDRTAAPKAEIPAINPIITDSKTAESAIEEKVPNKNLLTARNHKERPLAAIERVNIRSGFDEAPAENNEKEI